MTQTIKARPTMYNGIQMRSRLEARYAQRLDNNGQAWTYEPECFADRTGQYLPDFHVTSSGLYVEVKHENANFESALERMHIILSTHPDASLLVAAPSDGEHWLDKGHCLAKAPCGRCHRIKPKPALRLDARLDNISSADDEIYLLGPTGGSYTHLENVTPFTDQDGRLGIHLHFSAEDDDSFVLSINNQKGATVITSARSKPATGADRLTQAFPGAILVDDETKRTP